MQMSIEAAVAQYKKDFVPAFEQKVSQLKATATKESVVKGNTVYFDVNGSATDEAVTRGSNGDIPYGNPTNNQVSATLVEKHAPYAMTGFNVFASQGDQVSGMRNQSIRVINRDIDKTFLTELANATQDFGTGTAKLETVLGAQAILGNNDVDVEEEDNMFCVISPAFRGYLMQTTEFSSGLYVEQKPFAGPARKFWRWSGINWIVSSRISGLGTSAELCYMYHRAAIGYAVSLNEEMVFAGFNEEQGRSWARAEVWHASKILQNSGIVKITHDGSAFVPT
jgi:hypothetical protein